MARGEERGVRRSKRLRGDKIERRKEQENTKNNNTHRPRVDMSTNKRIKASKRRRKGM